MPRGRKSTVNYEAQLQALDEKIAFHDRQIAALKSRRAELEEHRQAAAVKELSVYLESRGLTAGELLSQLPVSASSVRSKKTQA